MHSAPSGPKQFVKSMVSGCSLLLVCVPAALCGFGRWETIFTIFAHIYALTPGIVGDYLRTAFYKLTLAECSLSSRISFGSFFAHTDARVGANVYIGCNCIIGKAAIGERTQIASGVQILSGRHQHLRNESGGIGGAEDGVFTMLTIGPDCWIGAACVVMADVESGSTIGAGSVVSRPIPPNSVAVGSPARVLRAAQPD
jgi:virginiamycin A acetyltransferase